MWAPRPLHLYGGIGNRDGLAKRRRTFWRERMIRLGLVLSRAARTRWHGISAHLATHLRSAASDASAQRRMAVRGEGEKRR